MNLHTVHAIVVYFLSNFIFKQSIYYRMSMQNSRTIALELILGLWLWWGSGGVSRSGKLAGSGKLTVGYVTGHLIGILYRQVIVNLIESNIRGISRVGLCPKRVIGLGTGALAVEISAFFSFL